MVSITSMLRKEVQGPTTRGDMGDQSVVSLESELQVGVAVILDVEVQEEQLARHRKGAAGICDVCGDPISQARLKAKPYAIRCMDCQEKYEEGNGIGFRPGRRK